MMQFTLNIWRQDDANATGEFKRYEIDNISADDSFLEMLDQLNEKLIESGEDAVSFDYDCREGICGACGLVINGHPHGKKELTTTCQLYMREYANEKELWIEPWRADAFPVIKDLVVDRTSFDRIIRSGGYASVKTGNAVEANSILIDKPSADKAFHFATCIGCGACVAVCPNTSASLFVAAKVSQLDLLPQGKIESKTRARKMVDTMESENFGSCSNHGHCHDVCPKGIPLDGIATLNSLY